MVTRFTINAVPAAAEAIVPLVHDRRAAARQAAKKRDGAA
jgi:hypothetical protein